MVKQLWGKEFDKFEGQSPAIFEGLDRWSPELEEELSDLLRAVRRKKGFSLFFVQCSPALGERIIEVIRERFPQKKLARFELDRESKTLYRELIESYQTKQFEIACVTGIEQTLYAYEDTKRLAGWSEQDIYNYSWKGVPPLLSHLNYHRELFEENLPVALIFLVPRFAIDYFVQRAPDFFDWRSGFFKFMESSEDLQKYFHELVSQKYGKYLDLTPEQRMEKILEIKDKIFQIDPSDNEQKSNLLREQGRLFESGGSLVQALECHDRALTSNPKNYNAWHSKSCVLHSLERYEEAIQSCDRVLEMQPSYYRAWGNRGKALYNLQRYEEAIESYDRALEIQPNYYYAWNNRGITLRYLKQYEEAIESYDRALEISPDFHPAWNNRGIALYCLKRYEEAIKSCNHALKIDKNYYYCWFFRGYILGELELFQEAIKSYETGLEIKIDDYQGLVSCGNLLRRVNRYQKALDSFERALKIQPNSIRVLRLKARCLEQLNLRKDALDSYTKIREINSNNFWDWYYLAYDLYYFSEQREIIS